MFSVRTELVEVLCISGSTDSPRTVKLVRMSLAARKDAGQTTAKTHQKIINAIINASSLPLAEG